MRIVRFVACCWFVLCLSACRHPDPSVDLLEGELRWMEDQLYMMEGELESKCHELADCRRQQCVSSSVGSAKGSATGSPAPPDIEFSGQEDRGRTGPTPDRAQPTPAEPPEFTPPDIELPPSSPDFQQLPGEVDGAFSEPAPDELEGSAAEPAADLPESTPDTEFRGIRPRLETPLRDPETRVPDTLKLQSYASPAVTDDQPTPPALDAHVTHIVISAQFASHDGFRDVDNDPDIRVFVQPRNADGQPVALTGPVSVVVLDGAQSGQQARVARWDYTAAEARRLLRSSTLGSGMHLDLRWPEEPPHSDQLQLFVRYVTVDERKLEADQKLDRQAPGMLASPWEVVSELPRLPEPATWTVIPADPPGDATNSDETAAVTWSIISETTEAAGHQWKIMREPTADDEPLRTALPAAETSPRPKWRPYR